MYKWNKTLKEFDYREYRVIIDEVVDNGKKHVYCHMVYRNTMDCKADKVSEAEAKAKELIDQRYKG